MDNSGILSGTEFSTGIPKEPLKCHFINKKKNTAVDLKHS